jgi:CRP-like cAMP-binding protein
MTPKPTAELFAGFTSSEIQAIRSSAARRNFRAGQIICRTGESATHLFLLETGAVNYYRVTEEGSEILLTRLSPGEAFGLGTLLPRPTRYIGTAESISQCEIYIWEHRWVRQFAVSHPRLAENALRISLEYIRLYAERHVAFVSLGAENRLVRTVASLGTRIGTRHPHGLEIPITNEHLASLSDLGPFTVSRLLKKLERKGALHKRRGKVVIRCPEKMLP